MQTDLQAEGAPVARRYDYDDRAVIAADFGPGKTPIVEVLDGTVIIVVDDEQEEIDVPAGDVETFTRNGVVIIEVRE